MPTVLTIETVHTLREFTERIEAMTVHASPLWYRGSTCSRHRLVPSLYRHPTVTQPDALIELESEVIQRFRERSIPYLPAPFQDEQDWQLLFLMQHFGVPTRLLDWTENPFIGLFFALAEVPLDPATGDPTETACVWILRPALWNQQALSEISFAAAILSVGSEPLESYQPSADARYMRTAPVAMYGLHNSPRIVAQRGVFTIFGKETSPMDELFSTADYDATTLTKLEIPVDSIMPLRESLFSIGTTDSVVFPDLEGLAKELKRFFGFVR